MHSSREKAKAKDRIDDQLREAIGKHEGSLYGLAAEAGVHRSTLTRFARGESSLSLDTAAAVAGALGLRLVQGRKPARKA